VRYKRAGFCGRRGHKNASFSPKKAHHEEVCMSRTPALDNSVRVELYTFFVEHGRAPVPAEVARSLGEAPYEIELSYKRLADARVLVLAPGTPYIWMANPFSALPTPYRVRAGDREWWANCIWDAMGVIALLHRPGEVATFCPDCGDEMVLKLPPRESERRSDIVHYAVPAAHWWDDIGFN
jgi:hypothetical protein